MKSLNGGSDLTITIKKDKKKHKKKHKHERRDEEEDSLTKVKMILFINENLIIIFM